MSKTKGKGVVDGATLSVELKPKPGEEDLVPLGKTPPVVDGKAVALGNIALVRDLGLEGEERIPRPPAPAL